MSATRDLIAAALTAAGSIRWQYPELSDELRELCARAMVQPAAPDMAEVERMVDALDGASYWSGHHAAIGMDPTVKDESRAALLDYVRGVLAERDALVADNERLSGLYEQAVKGRADMRGALRDARAAAPQPVSAAEVPMPDVHDYGYLDSDIGWVETLACDEADVRTYGDAREAAGYARGLAEAGKDVERYLAALVRVQNFPSHPGGHPDDQSSDADDAASWRHGWICAVGAMRDHALPDDAALRGEVKQ